MGGRCRGGKKGWGRQECGLTWEGDESEEDKIYMFSSHIK